MKLGVPWSWTKVVQQLRSAAEVQKSSLVMFENFLHDFGCERQHSWLLGVAARIALAKVKIVHVRHDCDAESRPFPNRLFRLGSPYHPFTHRQP